VANVLGIGLALPPASLQRPETPQSVHGKASLDPTASVFDRQLSATMIRGARSERTARTEVAPARTPLSGTEAASALRSAWTRVFGQAPTDGAVSLLVAQWAHETGSGASMFNYNFGGIKGASPAGLTTAYGTHEGSGAETQKVVAHFRAYRTAADGAEDYLRLLSDRFPSALQAARGGDAPGFVHALKRAGYFTDSEDTYARSVCALAERVRSRGYDAIGPARGALERVASVRRSEQGAPVAASPVQPGRFAPSAADANTNALAAARAIDVARMGDELARAALRIAEPEPRDEDA
jgi:hypothetical protein